MNCRRPCATGPTAEWVGGRGRSGVEGVTADGCRGVFELGLIPILSGESCRLLGDDARVKVDTTTCDSRPDKPLR